MVKYLHLRISILNIFVCLVVIVYQAQSLQAQLITLENKYVRIGLDQKHGRLTEIVDLKTGRNFIAVDQVKGGIWQLELIIGDCSFLLVPAQAELFKWEKNKGELNLQLIWQEFGLESAPDLRVVIWIRLEEKKARLEEDIRRYSSQVTRLSCAAHLARLNKAMGLYLLPPEEWMGDK